MHFDAIKSLAKGMATGISLLSNDATSTVCVACMAGKQHIVYGKNKMKRATRPLERIHSDTSGLLPPGVSGSRYYIVFIDDFSRYTWVYFLKTKSAPEVCQVFRHFRALVEHQTGHKIKYSAVIMAKANTTMRNSKEFLQTSAKVPLNMSLHHPIVRT